ncbi:MAG: phosphate ABC transporter permease PstA [Methanobacterium paludis]|uniref:phosphate ABC transporter permease PstA n=1 Tax=Methanobacterium paludis (strain DSM 25820 / JCM 18151 / SWAN1) TaxID=868131 RepID=UPI00064FEC8E|nr:phosphate ABC transporter permease PstA [Methanobacterium paludis]MCE7697700.1 phosphate ABC transporter permease PstA [Methanobacterium paludis]
MEVLILIKILSPNNSQKVMNAVLWGSGLFTIFILIVIIGYILFEGLPVVNLNFLLSDPIDSGRSGGIFPMIVSTFYVTFIAVVVATPLGVGAAVFLSEYAGESRLVKLIRFGSETLASIPSIVFGLFGLAFFVVFLGLGWSVISGALTLSFMALPTILRTAEVSIETVPQAYKEGSLALGATKWQTIYKVVLPAAIPGITTGIILGMARAMEETAAILYTVGAALSVPISMFDPARPLPLHLYILATEGISLPNAYGTAAVLVILILGITIVTNTLVERYTKKMMGR